MSFLYWAYNNVPNPFQKFIVRLILSKEGGYMYSSTIRRIYSDKYKIDIGYGTYGGCFNKENIPDSATFGNYCSIANNIRIFRANHPKDTFTSHPLLYNPVAGYVKTDKLNRTRLIVGHDVWIGEWSVILPNVTKIGNGAIIGAGSIVTKDVAPYSVVAGNPAQIIGMRFKQEQIDQLEKTEWWNLSKDELKSNIENLNAIINNNHTNE